jgi:hypothetical protein
MASKSSYMLAVLFIANPFVLLFYQNCSSAPTSQASINGDKKPASVNQPAQEKPTSAQSLKENKYR